MGWYLAWMRWVLRLLLAMVFIVAAVGKLRGGLVADTPRTLYDAWLPAGSAGHYAFILFELLLAAWLLSGLWPRWAAGTAAGVLIVFSMFIGIELNRSAPRPCGCLGGKTVRQVTPDDVRQSLYRSLGANIVLILAAGWCGAISAGPKGPFTRES